MRLGFAVWIVLAALVAGPATAQGKPWTVELTRKQAAALVAYQGQTKNWAFAISPDGAWGQSKGFASAEAASQRALQFCRNFLKNNRRDCIVHTVNGQQVAPAVVDTKKVKVVYSPINGRQAPAAFGLAGVNFQGNFEDAVAQLARKPTRGSDLPVDGTLGRALLNKTVMSVKPRGWAVWLGAEGAVQMAAANGNKILFADYPNWTVTPAGLVCLFDGRWFPSGQPIGTRCFLLHSIANGKLEFSWGANPRSRQKGNLIAGDARWAQVR